MESKRKPTDNLELKAHVRETVHQREQKRRRMMIVLGAIVVFATALALMVPAISATKQTMPEGTLVTGSSSLNNYPEQSFKQDVDTVMAAGSVESDGSEAGDNGSSKAAAKPGSEEIAFEREAYGFSNDRTLCRFLRGRRRAGRDVRRHRRGQGRF